MLDTVTKCKINVIWCIIIMLQPSSRKVYVAVLVLNSCYFTVCDNLWSNLHQRKSWAWKFVDYNCELKSKCLFNTWIFLKVMPTTFVRRSELNLNIRFVVSFECRPNYFSSNSKFSDLGYKQFKMTNVQIIWSRHTVWMYYRYVVEITLVFYAPVIMV